MVPLLTKYLWRKGYLRVPDKCSVKDNGGGDYSNCRTSCPSELYTSRGMSPYDVLMDVSAVHWFAAFTNGTVVSTAPREMRACCDRSTDAEAARFLL